MTDDRAELAVLLTNLAMCSAIQANILKRVYVSRLTLTPVTLPYPIMSCLRIDIATDTLIVLVTYLFTYLLRLHQRGASAKCAGDGNDSGDVDGTCRPILHINHRLAVLRRQKKCPS